LDLQLSYSPHVALLLKNLEKIYFHECQFEIRQADAASCRDVARRAHAGATPPRRPAPALRRASLPEPPRAFPTQSLCPEVAHTSRGPEVRAAHLPAPWNVTPPYVLPVRRSTVAAQSSSPARAAPSLVLLLALRYIGAAAHSPTRRPPPAANRAAADAPCDAPGFRPG
jgi:hypothetical protein